MGGHSSVKRLGGNEMSSTPPDPVRDAVTLRFTVVCVCVVLERDIRGPIGDVCRYGGIPVFRDSFDCLVFVLN